MVSHGTAKKRRRGLRVTRKANKHINIKVVNKLPSSLREGYDKRLSPADNLQNLGLDPNPNVDKTASLHDKKHAAFIGLVVSANVSNLSIPNPNRNAISEYDQEYAKTNIDKHGTNYKAMERDMKTNFNQYTENQMRKMCLKFLLATPDKME